VRRPLLALSLTVILAAPSACGGDPGRSAPHPEPARPAGPTAEVLAEAWSRARAAGTSRLTISVSGGSPPFRLEAHGAVDLRSPRGRLRFDLPALVTGQDGGSSELLLAGDVTFVKLAPPPGDAGGPAWLRIDLADLAVGTGIDLAVLRLLAGADVSAPLGSQLPVDLSVDEHGRLRRVRYATAAELAPGAVLTTTVELHDFGVAVDVVAPPADQVVDLGPLLREQRPGSRP
jgi:hypothetical protein